MDLLKISHAKPCFLVSHVIRWVDQRNALAVQCLDQESMEGVSLSRPTVKSISYVTLGEILGSRGKYHR